VKRHVYISGPMRGRNHYNFQEFIDAEANLRILDPEAEVFSPARRDLETGFNPILLDLQGNEDLAAYGFDLREALAHDAEWICRHATEIYMLRGWSKSKGALAEKALAQALGLKVTFQPGALNEDHPAYDAGWNDAIDYVHSVGVDSAGHRG